MNCRNTNSKGTYDHRTCNHSLLQNRRYFYTFFRQARDTPEVGDVFRHLSPSCLVLRPLRVSLKPAQKAPILQAIVITITMTTTGIAKPLSNCK